VNFDEYEKRHYRLYADFAETIRAILERALEGAGVARTAVTCRAKDPSRLRVRLEEAGYLTNPNIETIRRDLAGVRIILYTDGDVDKLNNSRLIWDNFEVEDPKIHHPTPENSGSRYRGIHYTVKLGADRTKLPEYAKFAGLRCEIQIQTILHHAWSETSHDIVYKGKAPPGFGSQAMKRLEQKFNDIMDNHLIPAGQAIQQAQDEYERLMSGKALFDADAVRQLEMAQNNNERFDILSRLKTDTIPNFDDIPAAFRELREPLVRAARNARNTPKVPISTSYGTVPGYDWKTVIKLVIEILVQLRYAEPVETLKALATIYREETDEDLRKEVLNGVTSLAEFSIPVWKQVGPGVQLDLVEYLDGLSKEELASVLPIALTVWGETLESNITGTSWSAEAVTWSRGAIGVSDQLKAMRSRVMAKLFKEFDNAADDVTRREILNVLDKATHLPGGRAEYSDELLALTLENAKEIVEFLTARAGTLSYELMQHIEHGFLYDYYRSKPNDE
jgi:ppGpp synthetase/RelA/SpoT-type nucleotidyltranferase